MLDGRDGPFDRLVGQLVIEPDAHNVGDSVASGGNADVVDDHIVIFFLERKDDDAQFDLR